MAFSAFEKSGHSRNVTCCWWHDFATIVTIDSCFTELLGVSVFSTGIWQNSSVGKTELWILLCMFIDSTVWYLHFVAEMLSACLEQIYFLSISFTCCCCGNCSSTVTASRVLKVIVSSNRNLVVLRQHIGCDFSYVMCSAFLLYVNHKVGSFFPSVCWKII
jgi:hypothetical protein